MLAAQRPQQIALMGRILVEAVKVRPEQALHPEARQFLANIALGLLEHAEHRLVAVDDPTFVVGQHDVGGRLVERIPDAQVGSSILLLRGNPIEQAGLHFVEIQRDIAKRVF